MRILVGSEDRRERELIRRALAVLHATVDLVEDGAEAYMALRDTLPDVAILSAELPRVDGIILVRTITRSPHLQTIRTLLVLGARCAPRVRDALEARPGGLIVRPFDADVLLGRLDRVIQAPPSSVFPSPQVSGNVSIPAEGKSAWQVLKARLVGQTASSE